MEKKHQCLRLGKGVVFEALLKSEFGHHISDNPFEQDREVWQTSSALAMCDEEILPCCSSELQSSSALDMSDGDADAFAEILPCCSSELQLSSALDMSDGDADAFAESLWYDV